MKQWRIRLVLCSMTLLPTAMFAQKVTTFKTTEISEAKAHQEFYLEPDNIVSLEYKQANVIVYDRNLKPLYQKEIPTLKEVSYEAGISNGKQLSLFCSNSDDELIQYEFDVKKGTVQKKEKLIRAFKGYEKYYYTGFSADSSYGYLVCKGYKYSKKPIFTAIVFDRQMKVVHKNIFKCNFKNIERFATGISNNGEVTLLIRTKVRRDTIYEATTLGENNKIHTVHLSGVKDSIHEEDYALWLDNGAVKVAGMVRPEKGHLLHYLFIGTYDVKTGKRINQHIVPVEKGLPPRAELRYHYLSRTGASFLIYGDDTNMYSDRGWGAASFGGGDVFILKINQASQIEYIRLITKKQTEGQGSAHAGIIPVWDAMDNLKVYFLDLLVNKEVRSPVGEKLPRIGLGQAMPNSGMACVSISANGETQKTFVTTDETDIYHMIPRETSYVVLPDGSLVYTANHFRLSRTTHKLGIISYGN